MGEPIALDADTRRSAWLFALYRVFVASVLLILGLIPEGPVGCTPRPRRCIRQSPAAIWSLRCLSRR